METESEIRAMWPRAKECTEMPGAGGGRKPFLRSLQRQRGPDDALIWDLWLQTSKRIKSAYHPVEKHLVLLLSWRP